MIILLRAEPEYTLTSIKLHMLLVAVKTSSNSSKIKRSMRHSTIRFYFSNSNRRKHTSISYSLVKYYFSKPTITHLLPPLLQYLPLLKIYFVVWQRLPWNKTLTWQGWMLTLILQFTNLFQKYLRSQTEKPI